MKWVEDKEYKLGDVMNAFRLALVGIGKDQECSTSLPFLEKKKPYIVCIKPSKC